MITKRTASKIAASLPRVLGVNCFFTFPVPAALALPFVQVFLLNSLHSIFLFEQDFKKASNEEKTKAFPALLKGYQEEVDNLTKRAKFGENAFLNVYQKLYEAPDPVPALSSGAVSSHSSFLSRCWLLRLTSNSMLEFRVYE